MTKNDDFTGFLKIHFFEHFLSTFFSRFLSIFILGLLVNVRKSEIGRSKKWSKNTFFHFFAKSSFLANFDHFCQIFGKWPFFGHFLAIFWSFFGHFLVNFPFVSPRELFFADFEGIPQKWPIFGHFWHFLTHFWPLFWHTFQNQSITYSGN